MSCTLRTVLHAEQASFCSIEGDANLYGLGIRIGTYLIWTASLIAYNVTRSETSTMRILSGLYQLSTLLALFIASASERTLFAVEPLILLGLCIGGLCTSTDLPSSATYTALKCYTTLEIADLGSLLRVLVLVMSTGYGMWYSFTGFDNVCRSLCGNSFFFFSKVSLYGWYRELLQALFVLYAVGIAILAGNTAWSALFHRGRRWSKRETVPVKTQDDLDESRGGLIGLSIGTVIMVIFIIAIELTIYWNRMENVHSCGSVAQLLPLIIGIAMVCKTFLTMGSDRSVKRAQLKGP